MNIWISIFLPPVQDPVKPISVHQTTLFKYLEVFVEISVKIKHFPEFIEMKIWYQNVFGIPYHNDKLRILFEGVLKEFSLHMSLDESWWRHFRYDIKCRARARGSSAFNKGEAFIEIWTPYSFDIIKKTVEYFLHPRRTWKIRDQKPVLHVQQAIAWVIVDPVLSRGHRDDQYQKIHGTQ